MFSADTINDNNFAVMLTALGREIYAVAEHPTRYKSSYIRPRLIGHSIVPVQQCLRAG